MIAQHYKILFLALTILAGCTAKREDKLEIRVHIPQVDIKIDPHKMEDAFSMMIVSQLYRGLLRFNPTGDIMPDIAESWTESVDRLTYRFKLRETTFSNGEPVTSKHVLLSFARLFNIGAAIGADIDYIKGASTFAKSKNISDLGIKPISDREIEFQLSQPSALFLKHMAVADCAIFALKDFKDPVLENEKGVFSGPYKLTEVAKETYQLVKWRKDSFDSPKPPQKIIFFETNEDPVALALQDKTDSLDHDPVLVDKVQDLKKRGWGTVPTELTGETFIVLNPKHLPADLRKYLYLKVDSRELVDVAKEPQFKPAFGLIPTGYAGELTYEEVKSLRQDVPAYKGKRISFQLDYNPTSEVENKVSTFLKKKWDSDLVEVVLNPMSRGEKLERMFSKKSHAILGRKGMDYPDGFSVLTYFKGKYDANYFHVDDRVVDSALLKVLLEFNPVERANKYIEIQKNILKHHTIIPLFFGSQASGMWSSRVKHAPSHPMGFHSMPLESIEMRDQ